MSMPRDRWGVFLIPRENDEELLEEKARVEAAMIGEYGEVGRRAWYEARHEMFETLLAKAAFHHVVEGENASDVVAQFVKGIDGRKRGAWGVATPVERRELARVNLAKIRDHEMRMAVDAALAHPAARDAGLWIQAEASLPPRHLAPSQKAPRDVSPEEVAEVAKRLDEFVAKGDEEFFGRDRSQDETPFRASLCELAEDDARAAASVAKGVDEDDLDASVLAFEQVSMRCRTAAKARDDLDRLGMVEAVEKLCERMPTGAFARNVYDVRQTSDLVAWLQRQRASAARDRILSMVRSAAKNGHAFAIVFFGE